MIRLPLVSLSYAIRTGLGDAGQPMLLKRFANLAYLITLGLPTLIRLDVDEDRGLRLGKDMVITHNAFIQLQAMQQTA